MHPLRRALATAAIIAAVTGPAAAATTPPWFAAWAQWRLAGRATIRPVAAPARIPSWAWATLTAMSDPPRSDASSTAQLTAQEQTLASSINAARAAAGLPALQIDPGLETAARAHVQELLDNGLFTHDFLRSGTSYPFGTWIWWYFHGSCAGENLAQQDSTLSGDQAAQLWLGSPEHRANLLSPAYTKMGVELAGENGTTIASNVFGC
jgi:uncharacterized protein YkwD